MNKRVIETLERTKLEYDIVYAGLVGSRCANMDRNSDWDVIVCTKELPTEPELIHDDNISQLVLSEKWLKYEAHEEKPIGLIPSILFRCIELSKPIIGNKPSAEKQIVKPIDFINCGIKMERFRGKNEKEYLAARIFYELLKQDRLDLYEFDNVRIAERLGLVEVSKVLEKCYEEQFQEGLE